MLDLKIGADPEIFVGKKGKPVSAYGMIPGNKKNPHPVDFGAVQVDGMALEFNIDPAKTAMEFEHNINEVLNTLKGMIPEPYEPMITSTANFTKSYLAKQPHEATELGCEPDYNCYTKQQNTPPNAKVNFRTAAGHVHIGWTEGVDVNDPEHFEACCMLANQLDWFLMVPSLLFDQDKKRRELYGQPGCFRPKSYGMEYRTLSNAWLKSPELIRWVFSNTEAAFRRLEGGDAVGIKFGESVANFLGFEIYEEAVTKYCKHMKIPLPTV